MEDMSSRIRFGGPFGYGGGGGGGVRSFRRRLKVYSPAFLEAIGKGDLAITVENGDKAVFPNNVLADVSEILARQQDGSALIFEVTSFVAAPSPSPSKPETDGKTNAPEPSHQQTTSSRTSSSDDSHSATTGTASSIVNDSLASDTNATSALLPATNTAAIAQSSSSTISASPPPIPTHRRTHIGVLEFSGEQRNVAYLPLWIMRGLKVNDGDEVLFVSRSLPPVSYLRLQPTDNSFFTSVTDPKLALEDALRNFTAVTEGDLLHISLLGSSIREEDESQNFFGRGHSSNYRQGRGGEGGGGLFEDNSPLGRASSSSSRIFVFKVLEVKPKTASKAASVVTADCEIQFEKNTNVGRDEEIGGGGGGGGGGGRFGGIDSFISSSTSLSRGVSDHAISDSLQQTNNSNFNTSSLTGRNTPTSSSSSDQHHHHQYSSSSNNEFADPVKLEASIGGAAPVRGVLTHGRGGGGYNRPGRAFFTIFVRDPACDILRVLLTCEGGENTDDSGTLNNAGGSGSISSSYGAMRSGSARGDDSMRESISRSKEAYFAQMLPDEPSLSKSRSNTLNSSSSIAVISAPKRGASGGGGGLSSSPSSSSSFSMGPSFDNSSSNLSSFSSHVDLFLSCSQTKPSRRVFTWGNFSTSRNKVLEISQSDPAFPAENELGTRVFYASIEAYSSDPSEPAPPLAYTISAEVVPRVQSDISSSSVSAQVLTSSLSAVIPNGTIVDSKSRSLSQSSSSSSSSSLLSSSASAPTTASASESISVNPPSRSLSSSSNSSSSSSSSSSSMPRSICKNCQQLVPTTTLAMHEPFCVRNNWRCDVCNAVIQMKMKASHMHCKECILVCSSTDEMRKHMEVLHSPHKCENGCGTRLVGPESHETHIRSECDLRQVNCLYCNMSLSFRTRFDHEKMCGGRTTQCDICNKNVVRMKLEMHKASGCSRHSSTPSISSSIRSSSTAAAAQIPSFALDGLEEGGGPLGLAASMFDSVFAAETGIGRGLLSGTLSSSPRFNIPPAAPSSSPRSNPVRLVSSVPYPSMTSRSRDTGGDDGGSDIEYNYDDDTYNEEEEEENEDNEGVGQNGEDHEQDDEEEDEESRAARLEYDTASRAQWEREALQRKERADAATAAAQSAVSCPSCDRQLPSFDDLTIHLLSTCSKRATQEHAAIVSNLLGEEAVNAIAHIEDDLRADVATTAAAASSSFTDDKSSLPSSSSSSLATATATTTGQDDVAQTSSLAAGEGFSTATQSESVTAPSNPPAVLGQRSDTTADNGQSVSSSSSIGQLPPPRRARRMLQCPCCFMIFDSSVNEDDVQVHVLTECPSPWTDVERALKWIKPAPEGTVATNSRTVVSSIPRITSPSSSSSSSSTSSSLSFAPHALTSSVIATSTDRGKDSTTITSSSSSFSTIDFPNPRSANMASGGSSRVEAAAEDDISLLLPRQSSRVISSSSSSLSSSSSSSSFSKRIAEFREPQPESIVSSSLRPSIFSSLVEDDDDEVDDDDSDVDKVKNDDASVKAAVTAAAVSSGPQEHSSLSRPSFPLPTDSGNSALFNAQCPSCGERMTMNEDDDMQLHMLTSCPNAEENAKTLFG